MGEYYLFANTTKRQYLHPCDMGENCKRSGLFLGMHGLALNLMLCRGITCHPLCGSWAGDAVIVTGDQSHSDPATTGDSGQTLYEEAVASFLNVSYQAIVMLCLFDEQLATQFVERAKGVERLLLALAEVVFAGECPPLEKAFVEGMGKGWTTQHNRRK